MSGVLLQVFCLGEEVEKGEGETRKRPGFNTPTALQELIEIKDTHRPRTLRQVYA